MPVEVVRAPGHSRKRSLGWLALAWMEHFLVHGPGDIQGRPLSPGRSIDAIPLNDDLAELTVDAYALDELGKRLYDSVFYSRAKGCDKSGHAARFGCFEFLGPCRFAGFAKGGEVFEWMDFRYVYEPGEPMGQVVTYPFLRILATEETQTGNCYDSIYFNFKEGPLREAFKSDDQVGLTRVFHPVSGEIRPSTASSSAKDGGKETWANFDETHLYLLPELHRMHATVRRNLTKRKVAEPWSFETSTMYAPGTGSVAELSHQLAKDIRDGKTRIARFLFDHREAFPDTNLSDEESLRRGLAEAYGQHASYQDFDRKIAEIWDPRAEAEDSRRYFLNQVTAEWDAWVTPQQWDSCEKPDREVAAGEQITLGLDPSESDDHTVLMGCCVSDSHLFPIAIFDPSKYLPDEDEDDEDVVEGEYVVLEVTAEDVGVGDEESAAKPTRRGRIPRRQLSAAVRRARERWDVVGFYSDVHPLETYIAKWEQEDTQLPADKQLCVKAAFNHPIAWDMRRAKETTRASEAYLEAIVEKDLTHSGDKAISQYHYNARRRPNVFGLTYGKGLKRKKIDGVPSAMLARQCRQDYLALPESKKRKAKKKVGVTWV